MPKGYKITSDPFYVNGSVTMTALNTPAQTTISLPLSAIDREGVIIHAIYFTSGLPERQLAVASIVEMQVTTTSKTQIVNANDANLLAHREIVTSGGAAEFSGPHVVDMILNTDSWSDEVSLGIVATDNCFLMIDTQNQLAALPGVQCRIVCSRIRMESGVYAALVTNELTS